MVDSKIIRNFGVVKGDIVMELIKGITKIRVIRMNDKSAMFKDGIDHQARALNGRVLTYDRTDDSGQIFCEETGLALIPDVDEFEVL